MDEGSTRELAKRVERASAADMVAFARALAAIDPDLGATAFPCADGHVVLCGSGMYVNAALAVGFDQSVSDDDLRHLESAAAIVGVPAAIEVSDLCDPRLGARLADRGYRPDGAIDALVLDLDTSTPTQPSVEPAVKASPGGPNVHARIVRDHVGLTAWQERSAIGWGHDTVAQRRPSDLFAQAAHLTQEPGLVLLVDAADDRPVGCASLSIDADLAMLGGMSTVPAERGQGVQTAAIARRLEMARSAGCRLAATHAAPDSGSGRNLRRAGFELVHTKTRWVRA